MEKIKLTSKNKKFDFEKEIEKLESIGWSLYGTRFEYNEDDGNWDYSKLFVKTS